MSNASNPYASPSQFGAPNPAAGPMRLADLGKRFLGALVDGLVGLVLVGPGYVMMIVGGASAGDDKPGALFFLGAAVMLVGGLLTLAAQVYLLATRSQTIGKLVMKTQIVDFQTGQRADLVHALLIRLIANGLIGAIPCIGAIYSIVDICFIFREDRRCIHDLLAKTVVVDIS